MWGVQCELCCVCTQYVCLSIVGKVDVGEYLWDYA